MEINSALPPMHNISLWYLSIYLSPAATLTACLVLAYLHRIPAIHSLRKHVRMRESQELISSADFTATIADQQEQRQITLLDSSEGMLLSF